ncbi:Ig-like domain-containing protein [Microvirga lotononidis]|uniref:VCBS repeat-containing protein n=1 Tax=Microvirga lotononidis TaxID=864069 RepID=I4YWL9_9HYPH|nr:Ig-like domain-containing protein [Microvirga lotononidis]EIM28361.1 VCBS repeat-containing protein [Microvirga lotononidis]WQO27554.1 Ig-like domain-containing protein [Microvirga lotononidis]
MYQSGDGATVFDIRIDAAAAASSRADTAPEILFPDRDVLFSADFRRSGADLLLVGHEASAVILDYFRDGRRLGITTPEGASITGDTVEILAGPDAAGQYAQAGNAAPLPKSVGRVEKVSGFATVLRNGVSVELRLGDTVAKGDVLLTGADSSLTIKFEDGTVFSLSSSARMVVNDMVYAADSTANSALLTLVQGVIGFVAGRIAKSGDLKVDTPVATMAIRGTAVQTEIAAFSGTTKFSLLTEPDGRVGSFVLLDKSNPSRVITSLSDARTATLLTPVPGPDLRITQITKTADDVRNENDFTRYMFQFYSTELHQPRGSPGFDDVPIIPVHLHQQIDPPDPSQFDIKPEVQQRFVERDSAPPFITLAPLPIHGTAVEDGPQARLSTPMEVALSTGAALPLVFVPALLPPGVRYLDGPRSFSLDPSNPAYQHLGEGESETVRVDFALVVNGSTRVPATISWTITGRNDAPIAASDHIDGVNETGAMVLSVRANDRDVDGNSLHIVSWTNPLEGSIFRNSSGDLVFDPGNDFRALSAGETATVSFAYTVSDGKGGTDMADVTLKVRGAGTFSSPHQVASASGVLDYNHQPVSLSVEAPSATTAASADLNLVIKFGTFLQPQLNIVYLVDVSGSTSEHFEGVSVGDLNGDGRADTVLDAEIASLVALTERVRGIGFSPADLTITIIPFNGHADPTDPIREGAVNAETFSLGLEGEAMIAQYLKGLSSNGSTDFASALQAANDRLQALDQGNERNVLFFLSDGKGQGAINAELARLNGDFSAKITALGVGNGADLSQLNEIDNTGGASLLTAPDQIDISVLGAPVPSGTVADIDLFVNGREIAGIGPEDLLYTPAGLALDTSIGDLRRLVGDGNSVSAVVKFTSGEVLATDLTIAGALPRSTDHIL